MTSSNELINILEFLNIEILKEDNRLEFVFNSNSIKEFKKGIINLEKIDPNYLLSIEEDNYKIYIKFPKNVQFKDCDVSINQTSVSVYKEDFVLLDYITDSAMEFIKYEKNPEVIYFKLLGEILNKSIIIDKENNIGIESDKKLFQFHIFNDETDLYGLRLVKPGDSLRSIPFNLRKEEDIVTFSSIVNLLKK